MSALFYSIGGTKFARKRTKSSTSYSRKASSTEKNLKKRLSDLVKKHAEQLKPKTWFFNWLEQEASDTLGGWQEAIKKRQKSKTRMKEPNVGYKFEVPHFFGKFTNVDYEDETRPLDKRGDAPPDINIVHKHCYGRKSRMFKNIKGISKPRSYVIDESIAAQLDNAGGWHGYSTSGFNRCGVYNPYRLLTECDAFRGYEALATQSDFLQLWLRANDFQNVPETNVPPPDMPDGAVDMLWPIESFKQLTTLQNGNQFIDMHIRIYLCVPKNNTNTHPIDDWYDATLSGSTDATKVALDTMNNDYSYPTIIEPQVSSTTPPVTSIMCSETSVQKGATPYFSERFKKNWNVIHVYKKVLEPGQNLNLKLEVEFGSLSSLKSNMYGNTMYLKDISVVPMITFYGKTVAALDKSTAKIGGLLSKTTLGSGPCFLLKESSKKGTIHTPNTVILGSDKSLQKDNNDFGYFVQSRELLKGMENFPFANCNTNKSSLLNPSILPPGQVDPTKAVDVGPEQISISVSTDHRIVPAGPIPEKEQ